MKEAIVFTTDEDDFRIELPVDNSREIRNDIQMSIVGESNNELVKIRLTFVNETDLLEFLEELRVLFDRVERHIKTKGR